MKKWILVVSIMLLVLVVGACSTDSKASNVPAETKSTQQPEETSKPKDEEQPKTEEQAETKQALRVVTLERSIADHLVALDIIPVGAIVRDGGDFEPYLAEKLVETESVGQSSTPNMEKILELKPDLIIGTDTEHAQAEDTLKQIATTLILETSEMEKDWQGVFLKIAEAVGEEEKAKQQLSLFEERVKDLKTKLEPVVEGKTIAFFKVTNKDARILGNLSPLGKIAYGQLGLKYPESLSDEKNETKISIEVLPEINPDYIFVMDTNVPKYEEALKETLETPLWSSLNAVKDNAISMVPLRATKTGFGLMMHNQFLDYVEQGLLGE